ncbi:hypothetical protein A2U01_0098093, partial [Trifolium medium]|nr:hypothetical protein [Trifolium medium]
QPPPQAYTDLGVGALSAGTPLRHGQSSPMLGFEPPARGILPLIHHK